MGFDIWVPTIDDGPPDFLTVFDLIQSARTCAEGEVVLRFDRCGFLRQNAVALLGGTIRLLQSAGKSVKLDLSGMSSAVRRNLARNGFLRQFGDVSDQAPVGNSVPYRQDTALAEEDLVAYLATGWLVASRVDMSMLLKQSIIGKVVEIYVNAFEHSKSQIGVFSCGQYYPHLRLLKLAVADFGIGIPMNVRAFLDQPKMAGEEALRWAFGKGNTTNPRGIGRGIGLELLRSFIQVNHGSLDVYSLNAMVRIGDKGSQFREVPAWFGGTVVNITINSDDRDYTVIDQSGTQPKF